MATEQKRSPTLVVTGKVRLSFAHLFEPHAVDEDAKAKYGTAILISKKDLYTLGKLDAALEAAKEEYKKKYGEGKLPPAAKFKLPLRDGDEEKPDDKAYQGHYFMNCSSDSKPRIVDINLNEILNKTQVYSGCYCRVSINLYPFKNKSMGIAAGLNNVQFIEAGESLGGGTRAEDDFSEDWDEDAAKSVAHAPAPKKPTAASKPPQDEVDEDDPEA